jgi:hypothetical protein
MASSFTQTNSEKASPTPTMVGLARDPSKWWPRPTAHAENTARGSTEAHHSGTTLLDAVIDSKLWPRPTASDAKAAGWSGYEHVGSTVTMTDAMYGHHRETRTRGPDGMVLCPEFVEALMGFPDQWSHVDDEHV